MARRSSARTSRGGTAASSSRRGAPRKPAGEGWHGWDDYAPFYDWENARTLGRRDVPFWLRMTGAVRGQVLELGCGTGRVTMPLAHEGVRLVGVDRSGQMLTRARRRAARQRRGARPGLVRADIRALPFPPGAFPMVMAPYGILQSLLSERDLAATLKDVARVVEHDGIFALELVADLPSWGSTPGASVSRGGAVPAAARSRSSSRFGRTPPRASRSSTRSSLNGAAGRYADTPSR